MTLVVNCKNGIWMFKKDNFLVGIVAGIIVPVACFGILFGIKYLLGTFFQIAHEYSVTKLMFVSVALNVLPVRYFYVAKNLPKIAMGVLLITVVLIVTVVLSF